VERVEVKNGGGWAWNKKRQLKQETFWPFAFLEGPKAKTKKSKT